MKTLDCVDALKPDSYLVVKEDGYDLISIFSGSTLIGEMGICTSLGCQCSGVWNYWGVGLSPHDLETLPHNVKED